MISAASALSLMRSGMRARKDGGGFAAVIVQAPASAPSSLRLPSVMRRPAAAIAAVILVSAIADRTARIGVIQFVIHRNASIILTL